MGINFFQALLYESLFIIRIPENDLRNGHGTRDNKNEILLVSGNISECKK